MIIQIKRETMHNKKSQTFLEVLSNYAWVLIALIMLFVGLIYFNVLDFTFVIPNRCNLGAEFTCLDYSLQKNAVLLKAKSNNNNPIIVDLINITFQGKNLSCRQANTSYIWSPNEIKYISVLCNEGFFGPSERKKKLKIQIKYHDASSTQQYIKKAEGELVNPTHSLYFNYSTPEYKFENGRWLNLSIGNFTYASNNFYVNHPSHYLYWPFKAIQPIFYYDYITGTLIRPVRANEITSGYKITKCINDGLYKNCTPDTSVGCNGVIKDYYDNENSVTVYDDSYKNCVAGNPIIGLFSNVGDSSSGPTFSFQNMVMSGYGKYQLCYKLNIGSINVEQSCYEFITDWIEMDSPPVSPVYNYSDFLNYTYTNLKTRYNNSPIIENYLTKTCYSNPTAFTHSITDRGGTVILNRAFGYDDQELWFGISNSAPPNTAKNMTVEYKVPSVCSIGNGANYQNIVFHNDCGYYNNLTSNMLYCCEKSWNSTNNGKCDKIESNLTDRSIRVTNFINSSITSGTSWDNLDWMYVYASCPTSIYGSEQYKYNLTAISGVDYMWINDMNYSSVKFFSEPFSVSYESGPTSNYSCQYPINECGRITLQAEIYHQNDLYGYKNTTPSVICVGGPKCPFANC